MDLQTYLLETDGADEGGAASETNDDVEAHGA